LLTRRFERLHEEDNMDVLSVRQAGKFHR
jgi:hypothetical protein